ncbi:hypothetical protein ACP4OV_013126 [Aristida adscensionis]
MADSNSSLLSTLPKNIPASFLREITDNFAPGRVLGKGAFGTVYKGILQDGEVIAVKLLGENSPVSHEKTFHNEVGNLMAAQHENIVKLVGYCHESQKKVVEHNGKYIIVDITETLLCYEFLPKGSLDKYIFDSGRIDWDTQLKIIKGICNGLHFLHKDMDQPVVHMDLKPDNILLDDNMVPKIADFVLSRLFGQEQTRMNTQNVVGAFMDTWLPNICIEAKFQPSQDIYSLGLLIIQISTGEKNTPNNEDKCGRKYIEKVQQNWTDHRITTMYASLDANRLQQIKTCIEIGLQCVESDRKKRPSIMEIVNKLNGRSAC